jgi:S1-C subfamily serine protease
LVINVTAEGPATQAGIHEGDIILSLNGRLIKGKDFEMEVAGLKPGTRVPVDYTRGSSAHEIWRTVGSQN